MDKKYLILIILGGIILFFLTMFQLIGSISPSLFPNVIIPVFIIYGLVIWVIKNHKEIAKPKEIFKNDNELNTKRIVCAVLLGLVLLGASIPVISYSIEKALTPAEPDISSTPSTNTDNSKSEEDTTSTDNQNNGGLVTITATNVHKLQPGEPAYNEGFFASIQSTDGKVYYIYQADAIALGWDLSKPFKAKVSTGTVGLNSNAYIIDEVVV